MKAALWALLALAVGAGVAPSADPHHLSSFAFDASAPFDERAGVIQDWLLERWRAADKAPEYRAHHPTAAEPRSLKAALGERLIGIWFIENLKGNGLADWVLDASSRMHVYTIMNPVHARPRVPIGFSRRSTRAKRAG